MTTPKANGLSSEEGIWASVAIEAWKAYVRRLIVFERDVCYVVEPGKSMIAVKPRKLVRTDDLTLFAETGFWNHGRISMRFDTAEDADTIEHKLRQQVPVSKREQRDKHS